MKYYQHIIILIQYFPESSLSSPRETGTAPLLNTSNTSSRKRAGGVSADMYSARREITKIYS